MREFAFIILMFSVISVGAVEVTSGQAEESPLLLKDGSYLFISGDNTMRMVNKDGKPVKMQDGVEMELEDGTLIMMKHKKIWRHIHGKMK